MTAARQLDAPRLSVVIPTYNRAERLRATLESLERQTLPPSEFEVIVIVDGSTDGTLEMLSRLKPPYQLAILSQPNSGQNIGRNRAVEVARGQYCLFIDDDIIAHPAMLAQHLRVQDEQGGVVALGAIRTQVPTSASWLALAFAEGWREQNDSFDAGRRLPTWRHCYGGNVSVPREAFRALGGFASDMRRGHDTEFGYRLQEFGLRFTYVSGAIGVQDEQKDMGQLVRDFESYGVAAVMMARRHPSIGPEVLPPFDPQGGRRAWLRRACLAARIPSRWLAMLGSVLPRGAWRRRGYRFVQSYCFWRGVERTIGDPAEWKRLIGSESARSAGAVRFAGDVPSPQVRPGERTAP